MENDFKKALCVGWLSGTHNYCCAYCAATADYDPALSGLVARGLRYEAYYATHEPNCLMVKYKDLTGNEGLPE